MDKIYFCKKGDIYSRKNEGIMSKKKSRVINLWRQKFERMYETGNSEM